MCVWRVEFKPKNMDSMKILNPKIWILHISYPKTWVKLCFSHKFDGKKLFLRYYRIESSKNDSCWNFLPPKIGKFILQILDPKNGFQVKFQTQNMARTPPYANMASTPPGFNNDFGFGILQSSVQQTLPCKSFRQLYISWVFSWLAEHHERFS